MTDETYRPKNAHDALARISEECHELGKVACKALRFGIYDYHPKTKKQNIENLLEEFSDVRQAMLDYLRFLNDENYPARNI